MTGEKVGPQNKGCLVHFLDIIFINLIEIHVCLFVCFFYSKVFIMPARALAALTPHLHLLLRF